MKLLAFQKPLRRLLTTLLASLTIWLGVAVAAAAAASVQSIPADQRQSAPEAADSGPGLLENIREKLNLDEPLPESTKLFFKQVQGEDVEVEEPRPSGKDNQPLQ